MSDVASAMYAFSRNLVVAASAGTGKTHSLVGVLVHLLLGAAELGERGGTELHSPVEPGRIVATTFSRKAAAEIRSRLVEELERIVNKEPRAKYRVALDAARVRAGRPAFRPDEAADLARRALDGLARAQIGTLHSFATTIAKRYALELGLSPGFELSDEDDTRARTVRAIERVISSRADLADPCILALVRAAGGVDRLVLQVASVLARLEEEGRAASDLVVAEDDRGVVDGWMRELVALATAASADPKIGARAAAVVAAWEVRQTAPLGLESAVVALFELSKSASRSDVAARLFAFRDALPHGSADDKPTIGKKLVASYHVGDGFAAVAREGRALLAECEREVARESRREGALGFGEVLRAARDVLRDHPACAKELGDGIDVLLVDEFQDTSRVQRDLVLHVWEREPLRRAAGAPAPISAVRTSGLFVVGDRKQSIYGFRGADVSVFAEVCVGLAGAPAREALGIAAGAAWEPETPLADFVPLRENRRSSSAILRFANAFSARRFRPAASPPALYEIAYAKEIEDLVPAGGRAPATGDAPATTWLRLAAERGASTRLDEAFAIAHACQRVVGGREVLIEGAPPRYKDVAVLAQTNRMLDACAFALAQAGIPFVVAGAGFYSAREVKDLAAMLAVVVHPGDTLALLEVLRGPWAGVRDETLLSLTSPGRGLADVRDWARGERRALACEEDREPLARVERVVSALRANAERLAPATILREAVRALGLEEVLVQLPRGVQRVANVRKVLAMAERHATARGFLEHLRDATEREAKETEAATFSEEDDAVRLLTVHASKGLEFPVVFIPEVGSAADHVERTALLLEIGCGDEPTRLVARLAGQDHLRLDPPSYVRAYDAQLRRDRAERARLAYVAATRAADALFFVGDRRPPKEESEVYARTTAAVLAELAATSTSMDAARLRVDDGERTPLLAAPAQDDARPVPEPPPPLAPNWSVLSIATTSLQDFAHCPRRFQLVQLLDLPERDLPPFAVPTTAPSEDAPRTGAGLDARDEGTLAHRILERIDAACFGGGDGMREALGGLLAREGLPESHRAHASIAGKVARFLGGGYASRIRAEGAEVYRELPFLLSLPDARKRTLALRGNIDLLVAWPSGALDVIDYKRARGPSAEPYAFQLDVYGLAARDLFPKAKAIRTGIVFLGGDASEPIWWTEGDARAPASRARLTDLAGRLVAARWTETFPRVPIARCKALRCGYVGLCHPERE